MRPRVEGPRSFRGCVLRRRISASCGRSGTSDARAEEWQDAFAAQRHQPIGAGGSRIHPDHLFDFGAIDRHGEKIGKHVLADLISGQRSELAQEASARRLDATAKLLEHLAGKGTSANSLASILPPAA